MMFLLILLLSFSQNAKAGDEISVVDVRRNITLAEEDPVYKDFYINAGPSSGLKKNLVVTAVRKINIRDAAGANAVGEIQVPVGQLRIIAVYDRVAVAREYKLLSRDELPMLEQTGIMTGDRIDLQGSFIDTSKPKVKKKVAEQAPAETSAATAVAAVVTTVPAMAAAVTAPSPGPRKENPVETANTTANSLIKASAAPASTVETLEKTADSGNNTQHE